MTIAAVIIALSFFAAGILTAALWMAHDVNEDQDGKKRTTKSP